jgi:hypothetical protein
VSTSVPLVYVKTPPIVLSFDFRVGASKDELVLLDRMGGEGSARTEGISNVVGNLSLLSTN